MALHKLFVDHLYDDSYSLLALHCTIVDYRIAYFLNQHLNIGLKRLQRDIDFQYTKSSYPIFEWEDKKQQTIWNLVGNICVKEEESVVSSGSLFSNNTKITRTHNLIPEMKKVNYFLKIENDDNVINAKHIVNKIVKIPQIAAAYEVDASTLKSRDNLIFN